MWNLTFYIQHISPVVELQLLTCVVCDLSWRWPWIDRESERNRERDVVKERENQQGEWDGDIETEGGQRGRERIEK